MRVHRASAQSYGARTSYGVWADICRQVWGIDHDAPYEKVVARLTEVLETAGKQRLARLPLLGTLLGLPIPETALTASLDARLRKASLESLIVELFETQKPRGGRSRWSWTQPSTWTRCRGSWPRRSAAPIARTPMLVLLASRPGDDDEPPLQALPHVHRLALGELDRPDLPPARRTPGPGPRRTAADRRRHWTG